MAGRRDRQSRPRPAIDLRRGVLVGDPGTSTVWLLRRFAAGFEYGPEGFDLDLAETARSLGLGDRSGRHSPFVRSINRTIQFGLAQLVGEDALSVRRRVPPLNQARLCRLSPPCRPAIRPGRTNS